MKKITGVRPLLVASTVVAALGIGITAGAAIAAPPIVLSPAGLQPDEGIATSPMPTPTYPANAAGESYGSALAAISPETEPELIQAVATNAKIGYVRKSELDEANGTAAAESFTSPSDAVKWQDTQGEEDRRVNVYARDGVTVIGTFLVAGAATQQKIAATDPSK